MNTQLVVFDIAGTTVADAGDINTAFRNAFLNAGYSVEVNDIDQVMGYRKKDAIKIILDKYNYSSGRYNDDLNLIDTIHTDFTQRMVKFYEGDTNLKPLHFAEEVFVELHQRKIKVALNTGFTKPITDAILKRLRWNSPLLIDAIISSDEVPEGRPHSFMIKNIMQQLNIHHAGNVVKVGDTKVDVEEGRNAGCGLVVAVTTGAYTREQLEEYSPDYIIDSLQQLPALIH